MTLTELIARMVAKQQAAYLRTVTALTPEDRFEEVNNRQPLKSVALFCTHAAAVNATAKTLSLDVAGRGTSELFAVATAFSAAAMCEWVSSGQAAVATLDHLEHLGSQQP